MQLNKACRERLIECVEKGLQEVKFKTRYLLDYSSFRSLDSCSLVPPRNIQELASNWISRDYPLIDFSYGFVVENRSSYSESLKKLSNEDFPIRLPEITDVAQMSVQIVDSFITLPWEYTVVLPFVSTGGLDFRLKQLPLSRELKLIIKKSSELRFPFPKPDPSPWARVLEPNTDWSSDRLYLEAKLTGYIGVADTETLEQFYHQARTVAGIGLAVDAFKLNFSRTLAFSYLIDPAASSKPLYVFQTEEGGETKERTRNIPDRLGPLDQLELENSDSMLLLPIAFGENDECSRLREAGQWYFASRTEINEIFEFVEAVVVLEILFNDRATSSDVGVEKLIANRCAYLIASSTVERQRIINDFKDIYNARSEIIHKGKARLSKAERALLIRAKALGSLSILKELGMILRSQQKEQKEG